jgi:hypothetical protein
MSIEWYYANGGLETGPISTAEVRRRFAEDRFPPSAQVWREGFESWQRAQDVPELKSGSSPLWRSVFKATLIGLAISFMVAAVNLGASGQIKPIDPYWTTNPGIIAYWIGRIGWLPLIFAVATAAAKYRHAGFWISALNLIGAIVAIGLFVSIAVVIVAATYPVPEFPYAAAGPERDSFVNEVAAGCRRTAPRNPLLTGLSVEKIQSYCICSAKASADITTREYIEYLAKHNTIAPDAVEKMTMLANKCAQSVRN